MVRDFRTVPLLFGVSHVHFGRNMLHATASRIVIMPSIGLPCKFLAATMELRAGLLKGYMLHVQSYIYIQVVDVLTSAQYDMLQKAGLNQCALDPTSNV